jgi:hypothetical protein
MSVVDDNMVELEESMILTPAGVSGGVPVTGSAATYRVQNNDFVSVSLKGNKRELIEGDALEISVSLCDNCSISNEAKNAEFSIKNANITISGADSDPVPAADLSLDLTPLPPEASTAFFANFSDTDTFKDTVLTNAKQDSLREKNEWFSIYITQDELCSNAECFGADIVTEAGETKITDINYTTFSNEGFIVIVNDDYVSLADTGVSKCLDISGSVTDTSDISCSSSSLQDVETHHEEGAYTFVNSLGEPVITGADGSDPALDDYQCIQDNYLGSLWDLNTLNTPSSFSNISIAPEYCKKIGDAENTWQLPTVADLINILNFNVLVDDGTNRFKNKGSYWTREPCLADSTKYWVVDMATGTTLCEAVDEPHHAYVVYY